MIGLETNSESFFFEGRPERLVLGTRGHCVLEPENIGKLLGRKRLRLGMRRAELALFLKLPLRQVISIESGRLSLDPDEESYKKICRFLGLEVS